MGRLFALALLALPLIEIAGFVLVGSAVGVVGTLLLVVAAAVAGLLVLRLQGLAMLARMRDTMGQGLLPGRDIADAMMIGAAGMLLLVPGFFTDIVGVLLLLPPVRNALYGFLRRRMRVVTTTTAGYGWEDGRRLETTMTIDLDEDDWQRR